MTFRGEYRDGVIVPDMPLAVPDGTRFVFAEPVRARPKARRQGVAVVKSSARGTSPRTKAARGARGKSPKSKAPRTRARGEAERPGTLLDMFRPFIGKVKGLPRDFAVNHDHYLYGVPKREP